MRSRNALGDDIVDWDGHSGLKVEDLHSKMQLGVLKGKSPKMIFLHIGGNNIVNTNVCKIIRQLKFEIRYIFENFQSAIIVWVFILPRLSWLWQGKGSDLACMNRKRQRVNRSISQFMLTQPNGRSLHIKSIDKDTPGFFCADNVHLSDIGNEMFILAVSEAVSLFLNNESDTPQTYLEV